MIAALLVALAVEPSIVAEECDTIEINHVYCADTGRENFTQIIVWDYEEPEGREHVRAWRMFKGSYPYRVGDAWQMTFDDCGTLRKIRSRHYRETEAPYDIELRERDVRPANERRELRR